MSKNFDIKINLRKLKSEVITTKKGTKCIIIPIQENMLFENDKSIYLELTAWELSEQKEIKENSGFFNTHLVKQKLEKEVYQNLSAEAKKNIPIIGNVTEYRGGGSNNTPVESETVQPQDIDDDDIPF